MFKNLFLDIIDKVVINKLRNVSIKKVLFLVPLVQALHLLHRKMTKAFVLKMKLKI